MESEVKTANINDVVLSKKRLRVIPMKTITRKDIIQKRTVLKANIVSAFLSKNPSLTKEIPLIYTSKMTRNIKHPFDKEFKLCPR